MHVLLIIGLIVVLVVAAVLQDYFTVGPGGKKRRK